MNQSKRWLEAARVLADHPDKTVMCPSCESSPLVVFDVPLAPREESNKLERYLVCPCCRKYNVILMNRREEQDGLVMEFEKPISLEDAITRVTAKRANVRQN